VEDKYEVKMMNRIAEKIQKARRKAGLSEKQLAKKCGLAASYIMQVETGKKIINEATADKILGVLGEEIAMFDVTDMKEEEKPVRVSKPVQAARYTVEPNEQWANALAGVIEKFPIYECRNNQVVGYKELPILGKKVEGFHPDKLLFVKASNNEAEALRIKNGDMVMVLKTKEIQNNSIYLIEVGNQRIIRKLRRESSKVRLFRNHIDAASELVSLAEIKLIGRCIRVEFSL
jgi:transcriptional regulator with XRE-family HTH domain